MAETFVPPDGGGGGNPYTDPDGLTTGDHATKVVVGLRVDYGRLLDRIIAIYRTINSDYSLGPLSYGDVHGNGGGGDVKGLDLLAPDGWVATGMNLRTGDEVDQVQLVFREWRGCAGLGRVERTSAVAGGTGGLPHTERASGNEFVCGIHGRSGYRNDALGPIYAVHPGDHGPPLVPFSAVSWLRGPMERHAGHGSN